MPPHATGAILAGIYTRISDDREGRELGVTRQLEDCRKEAVRIGATVVDVYTDNDISASTLSKKRRPEYERMIADVRSGRINAIIYYSNSRLTRRPLEYEHIITLYEETGVRLVPLVSGRFDLSTADGRMQGRIQAAIDAGEAERTAERIQRKLEQNRQTGRRHGGQHMTGWLKPNPREGIGYMEVLDPEAVARIQWAAEWLLAGGTKTGIMRTWNREGFKTANGAEWTVSTVQQLLASPRIAGLVSYRGEIVGKGEWPAVLDPEIWYAIQPMVGYRKDRKNGPTRSIDQVRKYLLSGVMKCGLCGTTMIVRRGPKRVHRYACVTSSRGGCGKVTRNKEWLEDVITAYVEARIMEEEGEDTGVPARSHEAIQAEIDALETRLRDAREAAMTGAIPMLDAGEIMTGLRGQIERLREEQANAVAARQASTMTREDILNEWRSTDLEKLGHRRAILARYVKAVHVHPLPRGRWRKDTIPLDSITIDPA